VANCQNVSGHRSSGPSRGVVEWSKPFHDGRRSTELLSIYTEALVDAKRFTALRQLTGHPGLAELDRAAVLDAIFRRATLMGDIPNMPTVSSTELTPIWARLHLPMGKPVGSNPPSDLPATSALPLSAKEYDKEQEAAITNLFESVYMECLLLGILDRDEVRLWCRGVDKTIWSHEAADALARLALSSAKEIENGGQVSLDVSELAELSPIFFPEHRDQWTVWKAFRAALRRILATPSAYARR
jgi:hypothetical protein